MSRTPRGIVALIAGPLCGVAIFLAADPATATIVRMNYTVGGEAYGSANFRMYDAAMPRSVANFLGYVDRYAGTFIHRNPRSNFTIGADGGGGPDGNFVVQGGGFELLLGPNGPTAPSIGLDPPIADEPGANDPRISNTRGTLSNAKSGPDTVTSQWFVNLGNNSFLDSPLRGDGGFAAFGRVLGDGMQLFDDIDLLQKRDLDGVNGSLFDDVPVGDVTDPIATLVVLSSVEVLDLPDGDYNFDGVVDAADFTVWRDSNGSTTLAEADGNGDGVVDADDLTIWQTGFGDVAGAAAIIAGVPEPSAALLAVVTLGATIRRRR